VQAPREQRIRVVDPVAQHVEVLADDVGGRQLDGGHESDRVLARGVEPSRSQPPTRSTGRSSSPGRLDCELHQMLTGHLWVMRVQASLALARSVEPGT
jgi:hypothetical protein